LQPFFTLERCGEVMAGKTEKQTVNRHSIKGCLGEGHEGLKGPGNSCTWTVCYVDGRRFEARMSTTCTNMPPVHTISWYSHKRVCSFRLAVLFVCLIFMTVCQWQEQDSRRRKTNHSADNVLARAFLLFAQVAALQLSIGHLTSRVPSILLAVYSAN